jgi:hypothetical protein
MNCQKRRKWRRENQSEIERVVAWINGPDAFESSGCVRNGVIVMRLEEISAFGSRCRYGKKSWKEFLLKKGIPAERFIIRNP